jgi:tetratricopeptide (TPR) repeat protein
MAKKKKASAADTKGSEFVGRRDILKKVYQGINEGETAIVLKGPEGVGKSAILTRVTAHLQKKKFDTLIIRGATSAEMILVKIAAKAAKKGYQEAKNIFASPIQYKEKLEKLLENYVYKEKILFIFEDFDLNQSAEGEVLNIRLNELITFLKDSLKEKDSRMIFCTQYDIPTFTSTEIEPLSWEEFLEMIRLTTTLQQLDKKSLKYFYFEMGGYPRAVELSDTIAHHEFGDRKFDWQKLRERVPNLTGRILHKESETADFSYLLMEPIWGYLNEKQQHILKTLSIYRGGISKDMSAAQNLEIKPYDRKKLVRLFLLNFTSTTGVYEVPGLAARTARGKMEEAERKQKHLCAAQYFTGLNPTAGKAAGKRTYEENDLEARWHYLEAGHVETALLMTFDMDHYFCPIGFPQFAFDLLKEMERYESELAESHQIRLHNRLAVLYSLFGQLDDALDQYHSSLKLNESLGDVGAAAVILAQLGIIYEAKGKYDDALEHYQKSREASEKIGNTADIAQRLQQIGKIHKLRGKYDEAFHHYQQALEINRKNNNQKDTAANLEQMGRIHDEQGKFDAALDYYKQSLEIKETLQDRQGIADLLHQVGNVNFFKGSPDEAFSLYQQSLAIKEAINDRKGAGYSLGQIGLILQRRGSIDEALDHFKRSMENFEKADEQKGIAASHHQIGRIYETKGDREKALTHYEKAVETREKTGDMLGAAITYGQLGMLYYQKEEYETALTYSTKAFAVFSQYGSPNAQLAKKNMLRLRDKVPKETFNAVLNEYNINPEPGQPPGETAAKNAKEREEKSDNP